MAHMTLVCFFTGKAGSDSHSHVLLSSILLLGLTTAAAASQRPLVARIVRAILLRRYPQNAHLSCTSLVGTMVGGLQSGMGVGQSDPPWGQLPLGTGSGRMATHDLPSPWQDSLDGSRCMASSLRRRASSPSRSLSAACKVLGPWMGARSRPRSKYSLPGPRCGPPSARPLSGRSGWRSTAKPAIPSPMRLSYVLCPEEECAPKGFCFSEGPRL
jgi:hypothetical protein